MPTSFLSKGQGGHTRIEQVLDKDICGILATDGAGFQEGEAALHHCKRSTGSRAITEDNEGHGAQEEGILIRVEVRAHLVELCLEVGELLGEVVVVGRHPSPWSA